MQENHLVTVICTCFNHQNFVVESLKSVLNQTYKNIQLIVVDDFSQDNSVLVIKDFLRQNPEILFIKNQQNIGVTKSFNNAMTFAKGAYFVDLACDDLLFPNCIEKQLLVFYKSKFDNLAIVYGNAAFISENGGHLSYYFTVDENLKAIDLPKSGDIYEDVISERTVICSVSAMISKYYFDKLKGYDESLIYEDLDFWIRASRNYNIEFTDEILVQKRMLNNSFHSNFKRKHNIIGKTTCKILNKTYNLNKTKKENQILKKRVMIEIKTSIKTKNFILFIKNCLLWIRLLLNS